jgi:hypothetical protein
VLVVDVDVGWTAVGSIDIGVTDVVPVVVVALTGIG